MMSPDDQSATGRTGGPVATRRRVLATVAGAAVATGSARAASTPQPPVLVDQTFVGSQEVIVAWDDPIDPCGSEVSQYEITDGAGETVIVPAGINRARLTRGEISLRTVTDDGRTSDAVTTQADSSVIVESSDTLSLDPIDESIPPGTSTWIPLRVHAGYQTFSDLPKRSVDSLSVSLTSPCVAEIVDVTVPKSAQGVDISISEDGSSATLSAEYLTVCDGGAVGWVRVDGRSAGHTSIVGSSSVAYRADPGRLQVSQGASDPVGLPPHIGSSCGPESPRDATDPDGDGLFEDLSGNGRVDFVDVNLLFQNTDVASKQSNRAYYDFSGDGEVNLLDVLSLLEEV